MSEQGQVLAEWTLGSPDESVQIGSQDWAALWTDLVATMGPGGLVLQRGELLVLTLAEAPVEVPA